MKKVLSLILLIGWALSLSAQSTTVSATITDTDAFLWKSGTYSFTLVPNPNFPTATYVWDGGTLATPIIGSLNGSGVLSQSVPSSNHITPAGSQWKIGICPNATSGCFSYTISVTGATLNLTSTLSALAIGPRFPVTTTGYGYGTVEVTAVAKPGVIFYDTTDGSCNISNGSTWDSCGGASGPATALSPNPTRVGQMWGYLHGAAPNQGWSDLMAQWYNPYDYGAAGDGTTNDDTAFTNMLAAALASGTPYNIMLMPRTGPFVLTTPVDFSGANVVFASYDPTFTGTFLYNGIDPGPAFIAPFSTIGAFVVARGTTTSGQKILRINDSSVAQDIEVYGNNGTDTDFVSVDFEGSFGPANVLSLITDSPIAVGAGAGVTIGHGSVNNLGRVAASGDPIQFSGMPNLLSISNATIYSGNTANAAACFIKLPDAHFNTAPVVVQAVKFSLKTGYTGHVLCGPTVVTTTPPQITGSLSNYINPTILFNGKIFGTLQTPGDNNGATGGSEENGAISFTNQIATEGFFYSAAGVPIPTPTTLTPLTSFVSDQTAACTGTYTSGGAVKCKVWWNGSVWTAF